MGGLSSLHQFQHRPQRGVVGEREVAVDAHPSFGGEQLGRKVIGDGLRQGNLQVRGNGAGDIAHLCLGPLHVLEAIAEPSHP